MVANESTVPVESSALLVADEAESNRYGLKAEADSEEKCPRRVREGHASCLRSIDDFFDDAYRRGSGRCSALRFYLIVLSLGVANSSFATSVLFVSYLLADELFEAIIIRGNTAWRGGLIASSVFAGMLIGGVFAGAICDRVGRKPMLLVALTVGMIANLMTAVAPDVISLSLARFVSGVAIGATEPPLFTLMTELSPPSHRGIFVTVVASFWMIGNIYVAVVGLIIFQYLKWSWRSFVAVCAFPSALGLWMVAAFVHESPRFLCVVKGLHLDATHIANEVAAAMGYSEEVGSTTTDKEEHIPRALSGTEMLYHYPHQPYQPSEDVNATAFATLLSDIQNVTKLYSRGLGTGTTIPLQVVWFSLCYGSYCLVTWINAIFVMVNLSDIYFNALMFALANLPGNVISLLMIDSSGRMSTLIWSLILSAVSLVVFAWYAHQSALGIISTAGIVLSACAFQALETSAWNSLDVMTSELFPTHMRSTGVGVCAATGRVGALVAQFASGALIDRPVLLLLVASLSFAVGASTPFVLEHGEMSKLPLTDDIAAKDDRSNTVEELLKGRLDRRSSPDREAKL